jgi:hypothetical protein
LYFNSQMSLIPLLLKSVSAEPERTNARIEKLAVRINLMKRHGDMTMQP